MALANLADQLNGLSVSDPEWLPFCPTEDMKQLMGEVDDIPRYLFRVFTPLSRGETDSSWTKSMDARDEPAKSKVDIFARTSRESVAAMLHRYFTWQEGPEDNLVSWTSSLLFALVYVFYLRANLQNGSNFDEIHLCIIDTTSFPTGVFLRDMDLIRCYRSFDERLQSFEKLRSGCYYFGEYVSQGSLKIEANCQIVSAQELIDGGLYDLQPQFKEYAQWQSAWKRPWANSTIDLRESFYQVRQGISQRGLQAAINIAQLFDQRWKLPVAVNFLSLVPHRSEIRIS
jgi:hypothetical protein